MYKSSINFRVTRVVDAHSATKTIQITRNSLILKRLGERELSRAFKIIMQALTDATDITLARQREALITLSSLSSQAVLPRGEREGASALKNMVVVIATVMGMSGSTAEIWSQWGGHISRFFGI